MFCLRNFSLLKKTSLRSQSKFYSTPVDKLQNSKPYNEIPGPSLFNLMRESALPGGKYYKLTYNEMMNKFRGQYGPIVKIPGAFGKNDVVMIYLPDDVEKVNRAEGKWPIRRSLGSVHYFRTNYRQDIFKDSLGLITTQGEEWYNFRSKVNGPLMQPKITKLYVPKFDQVAQDFVKKIRQIRDSKDEMPDDFYDNLNDFALESIAMIALDTRLGVIMNTNSSKLNQMVKDLFRYVFELDVKPSIWRYFKTLAFNRSMENHEQIVEFVNSLISEAIEKRSISDDEGVLDKLLKIDKKVAIVMVQDMLTAGIDTVAITSATVLYCLAKNPEKQENLRQEIFELLPKKDSELTSSSLNNIPYLRACMKEAMRLHPPVAGNARGLIQDLIIQGYKIPKNVSTTINVVKL